MISSTDLSESDGEEEGQLHFDLQFVQRTLFRESYFRNNRALGQKNIRCFPACATKHVGKHFCGRSVLVKIRVMIPLDSPSDEIFDWNNVRLIGEFNCEDDIENEDLGARLRFLPPTISADSECLDSSKFFGKILHKSKEMVVGDYLVSACLAEFNQENRGFNYLWTGSRFTTDTMHAFSVNVYKPIHTRQGGRVAIDGFEKFEIFHSARFNIESLRRRGNKLIEDSNKAAKQADSALIFQHDDEADVNFGFPEFFKYCADVSIAATPTLPKRRHCAKEVNVKRAKKIHSVPSQISSFPSVEQYFTLTQQAMAISPRLSFSEAFAPIGDLSMCYEELEPI